MRFYLRRKFNSLLQRCNYVASHSMTIKEIAPLCLSFLTLWLCRNYALSHTMPSAEFSGIYHHQASIVNYG